MRSAQSEVHASTKAAVINRWAPKLIRDYLRMLPPIAGVDLTTNWAGLREALVAFETRNRVYGGPSGGGSSSSATQQYTVPMEVDFVPQVSQPPSKPSKWPKIGGQKICICTVPAQSSTKLIILLPRMIVLIPMYQVSYIGAFSIYVWVKL